MDDYWEDVFLQAAGGGSSSTIVTSNNNNNNNNSGRNSHEHVSHGCIHNSSNVSFTTNVTTSTTQHTKNEKRGMKKKRRRSEKQTSPQQLDDDDHTNPSDGCYNNFYTLGGSFLTNPIYDPTRTSMITVPYCSQYRSSSNGTSYQQNTPPSFLQQHQNSWNDLGHPDFAATTNQPCRECLQPSGYHEMKLVSSSSSSSPPAIGLSLFVTIRNLRGYCRTQLLLFHVHCKKIKANAPTAALITLRKRLRTFQEELISLVHQNNKQSSKHRQQTYPNTILCDITKRNVQLLMQHINQMSHLNDPNYDVSFFLQHIKCIMKCDEIYSRLYYNDRTTYHKNGNTTQPPQHFPRQKDNVSSADWEKRIPSPLTYYSEWSNGLDNYQGHDANNNNKHDQILTPVMTEHPLYRIYQYRMAETLSLFDDPIIDTAHSSSSSSAAAQQHQQQQQQQLRQCKYDWDLSCRDDLCHIYCYATVSSTTLYNMIQYLIEQLQCHSIIEMGAGTGYLSYWLQTLGQQYNATTNNNDSTIKFRVSAYDIANHATAESTNEYHADMAGYFYTIHHGDGRNKKDSKNIYDSHYCKANNNENMALLLCYPPPDNEMGYDAIRNYYTYRPSNRTTTRIVIHIGEFNKGLTGTRAMEEYLLQHFQCIQRYPCHLYGSVDASDVSIWMGRSVDVWTGTSKLQQIPSLGTSSSRHSFDVNLHLLLVPCSHCLKKEAKRRCKYLRSSAFCSNSCFQQHIVSFHDEIETSSQSSATLLQQQLQQQLWKIIHIGHLDFRNHEHFEPLNTL